MNFDTERLLSFVLKKPRSFLYTYPDYQLSATEQQQYDMLLKRYQQGEPLAYLIGEQAFHNIVLQVTPEVLIPRPETELLVEKCLALLLENQKLTIADLGTGSGAIALAIAHERPDWKIIATDASAAALKIAQENAQRLEIENVKFYQGDWCVALPNQKFAAIISNPPYIDEHDPALDLAVKNYEPKSALIAADHGLADLKKIATQARDYLVNDGWLLLEHGYQQGKVVADFLENIGYKKVQTFHDLAGHPRMTVGSSQNV